MAKKKNASESSLAEMLNDAFEANPNANKLFQTSDGQCFFTEGYAKMHGRSLEEKEVKEHSRDAETETNDIP